MIRLKNIGKKTYSMVVTKCPISDPMKSPNPPLIRNPKNFNEKIPNPALITEADTIVLASDSIVEFGEGSPYNEEQGEYLYRDLGVPEFGGFDAMGRKIWNKNYIIEVNENGKEIKTNLYAKYRIQNSPSVFTDNANINQFEIPDAAV